MADDGTITSENVTANGSDTAPAVGIISQYIKDMSVENPNAPESYQWEGAPNIDVQFNIAVQQLADDAHEVELKITVNAKNDKGALYLVELAYCGLIGMRNVPEDQIRPFLYSEAPRIIFPFARRILADAVRDAGFQPLMLEPIDFNGLYLQQLAEHEAQQAQGGPPTGNA
ncbi:protein-export chaperone SecB [Parasphingorhabdus sp. DH2-15]|uniref:protein-export chaperone SecB n=1 Tax=Parasphingorhabdus sp. DH2-15 TaxID=3444112 RepID=UPI003F685119